MTQNSHHAHGCKLHVEASSTLMNASIYAICEKVFQNGMECFLIEFSDYLVFSI